MPAFGPISRRDLIRYLRKLGFEGPYPGTRHEFMVKGELTPRIPNPHRGEIRRDLLDRVLKLEREADAVLLVDPDRPPSLAVTRRLLQAVARRYPQLVHVLDGVRRRELRLRPLI